MNWHHFRAFVWLRWRLFVNQMTKGGIANQILLVLAAISAVLLAGTLLVVAFCLAFFAFPEVPREYQPLVMLLVWDGLIVAFLFSWCVGLLAELQRSEAFSLNKFLHLPVSIAGAFVLNYVSSLVSVSMLLVVPLMGGLCAGLILGSGPAFLLQLPLAAAFLFAATAVTYQFQGWLASLMVNKRRRRTIIVVVTLAFILIFQLPNLINIFKPWEIVDDQLKVDLAEVDRAFAAKEITAEERKKRHEAINQQYLDKGRETLRWMEEGAWVANMVVPIGWPAYGAAANTEGIIWPGLLGTLGLTLIGAGSLWRGYKTTLRIYTGQFTAGNKAPTPETRAAPAPLGPAQPATFFEKKIPWISEEAAVIALVGFRSLLRAPEVKMLLLSPIIMLVIFGGLFLRTGADVPEIVRPLMAFGAMAMILFTMGQLAGNQFGYDRAGFKIFVLGPAPRCEILLGKNLAILPIVAGLTIPLVVAVQVIRPMRFDYFCAVPFQFVSMFLIYCMLANMLSIFAPMPVATGSMKPISPKLVPILLHMMFVLTLPMAQGPTLVPWGIDATLNALEWDFGVPYCLILAALECIAIVFLYRMVVAWQGSLLHAREQKILEVVTTKAE